MAKFKFSKKWCLTAANVEKGCCVTAGKLTKEQMEYISGKKIKIKGLKEVMKNQLDFIEQVIMTMNFLEMYAGNPSDFKLLLGDDIIAKYQFCECWDNPEYLAECLDELTCDIVYKNYKFKLVPNGLFSSLHLSKVEKKDFRKKLNEWFMEGEWGI